jgi:NDP-sugar pyrophosphorylase family protein
MQAVILAAGRGRRLKNLTDIRSKAMQPILGKPMIERVMHSIYQSEITDFITVIRPDDNELKHYLSARLSFPASIEFAYQSEPLGMADALKCARTQIQGNFILSACDNLLAEEEIEEFIKHWNQQYSLDALLTVMPVPDEQINKTGIVRIDQGRIVEIVEKPSIEEAPSNIASLPIYAFSQRILDYLDRVALSKRGEYELQTAIQHMLAESKIIEGFPVSTRLTVTSPENLLEVNLYFLRKKPQRNHNKASAIGDNSHVHPPVYIEANVLIGRNCVIGPNVFVERGCTIKDGTIIKDSIMLTGAKTYRNQRVQNEVVTA